MQIRIPAEWEPHECCWMAWAVHREWDGATANKIKRNLSKVAQTVARYEPVRMLAPRGLQLREARREFAGCRNVTVIEAPVDDFWMRDIMPTFALRGQGAVQEVVAIDWNFNGWGGTRERPPRAGDRLAETATAIFGVPRICASCVAEGGALVTDGRGTLITTRSCLLNPNRNPVRRGVDRQCKIETELARFGIRQVIWLEGDPCEPITTATPMAMCYALPMAWSLLKRARTRMSIRRYGASTTLRYRKVRGTPTAARSRSGAFSLRASGIGTAIRRVSLPATLTSTSPTARSSAPASATPSETRQLGRRLPRRFRMRDCHAADRRHRQCRRRRALSDATDALRQCVCDRRQEWHYKQI